MVGSVLGLTAFILAFTFGIVFDRYDARKGLVRDEANAIGAAYLRADFLSEPDRTETRQLFRDYLDMRLDFAQSVTKEDRTSEEFARSSSGIKQMQDRFWVVAVANARVDLHSEVAALYIESLNEVFDIHALRVAVGIQARIPGVIWFMLFGITILGMLGIGYQGGISASTRSLVQPILAVSFALVITLIASLDRTNTSLIRVSQQPLIDLRESIEESSGNGATASELENQPSAQGQ